MKLSTIQADVVRNKVLVFQTGSPKLEMYVMDKVKEALGSVREFQKEITDRKHIKEVKEFYNIDPFQSERWLVTVELKLFKGKYGELIKLIQESTSVFYVCKSERYADFKNFKEALKRANIDLVTDLYLMYMKSEDFKYLHREIVPKDNQLSAQLADFVAQSYAGDVDAELELLEYLANGEKVTTRKEITDLCGIGGNTIDSFLFSLLKEPPKSAKGSQTVIRNRMKAGEELCQVYGYGRFRLLLMNAIKNLVEIKMLYISGTIYKKIAKLPSNFDEKKLVKYQRYFWKIKSIPMSRLLRLQHHMGTVPWRTNLEFAGMIYGYYRESIQEEVVPYLPKTTVFDRYIEEKAKEDEENARFEQEVAEQDRLRKLSLIKQYGVKRGKELFKQEKAKLASSVLEEDKKKAENTVEGTSNEEDEATEQAVALFQSMYNKK